ncbi:hypothetical protein ACFC58_03395 [Kitasatospora purpeofusca]|uniref:hypothetical protein n=1 Tax=Kitasatospora purpeofusca TaxID=67352 RepID=UPI0035E18357
MLLFFTDYTRARRHLHDGPLSGAETVDLLRFRAIPEGAPVLLDESTLRPVEHLCDWFRRLAFDGLKPKTMREYAYILLRFVDFLAERERDLFDATEWDPQLKTKLAAKTRECALLQHRLDAAATALHHDNTALREQARRTGTTVARLPT